MKEKTTYPLRLPQSLKDAVAQMSKADGTSINQFVATAVPKKCLHCEPHGFLKTGKHVRISKPSIAS